MTKPPSETPDKRPSGTANTAAGDGFALSREEKDEVEKKRPPRAAVLHEIIRSNGEEELKRTVPALAWSSLAAGLSMGFSMLARGVLHRHLGGVPGGFLIESLGYPLGFLMATTTPGWATLGFIFVLLPLWTSVLVRTYAWMVLLGRNGVFNRLLMEAGLTTDPIPLLHNFTGVLIGMVHVLLPYMVLPIYGAVRRIDPAMPPRPASAATLRPPAKSIVSMLIEPASPVSSPPAPRA